LVGDWERNVPNAFVSLISFLWRQTMDWEQALDRCLAMERNCQGCPTAVLRHAPAAEEGLAFAETTGAVRNFVLTPWSVRRAEMVGVLQRRFVMGLGVM
jgi:hypothetical protein